MAILASDKKTYNDYFHKIRQEYQIYDEIDFLAGRREILKSFLKKEKIFKSKRFYKYENRTRENIKDELEYIDKYLC